MNAADWQPAAGLQVARERAGMLDRARAFFAARNVLEVDTSILSRNAVTDPNIESLTACSSLEQKLFLQTSPEYKMKRLLAAGFGDIFQICKVFRDGELGRNHLPEFTMAEWYRLDFGLDQIMREAADFISTLLELPQMANNPDFRTYRDIFETALRIDPFTVGLDRLRDAAQADDGLRSSLGDDRDAWLDLLLSGTVVRGFPTDRLTVVTHYPASQAVLARLCPADAAMADRFEIFLGPLELANGFVELLDADEQAARFERDRATRRRQGKPVHDVDRELLAALRSGLPQCAGVAVGFDRLLMLHQDAPDVAAISHFVY